MPRADRKHPASRPHECQHMRRHADGFKFPLAFTGIEESPDFDVDAMPIFELASEQKSLACRSLAKELGNEYDNLHSGQTRHQDSLTLKSRGSSVTSASR